jgi:tetratricopeptide (TPR) repeat protein
VVLKQGNYTHAMALFQHAQGLFQDLRDRGGQAAALRRQAQLDLRMGRLSAAERRLRAALELLTRTDLRHEQSSILLDLGMLAQLHGRYAESEDTLQNAVEMCRAAGNRRGESQGLTRLGQLFVAQGKPDLARVVLDMASDIVAMSLHAGAEWEIQALLGDVAVSTGELDTAGDLYDKALQNAEARGEGEGTRVQLRIGRLHLLQHDPRSASEILERALQSAQRRRERGAEAEIWLAMARLHRVTVQLGKARDAIRHARTLAAAMGEIRLIAQCKAELGILRAAAGEDASFLLEEAARTARQLGCTMNSELGRAIGDLADRMGGVDPPTLPG